MAEMAMQASSFSHKYPDVTDDGGAKAAADAAKEELAGMSNPVERLNRRIELIREGRL